MAFEVEGKIALITGAATGLGFQYACELLKHGLKGVTIVDVNATDGEEAAQQLNNQYGKKVAVFVQADVTKSDEIRNAFKSALDEWKSLDIVINNAGIMRDCQWEKEIAINCNGVTNCCLLALEFMDKNRGGKGGLVVNASSLLGLYPFFGYPIYSGTKHFIVGMTRSFGHPFYYNLTGVKFLAICPGTTDTALISELHKNSLEQFVGLEHIINEYKRRMKCQTAEHVAKELYSMICQAENGSVWMVDSNEPIYEQTFPKYEKLS